MPIIVLQFLTIIFVASMRPQQWQLCNALSLSDKTVCTAIKPDGVYSI